MFTSVANCFQVFVLGMALALAGAAKSFQREGRVYNLPTFKCPSSHCTRQVCTGTYFPLLEFGGQYRFGRVEMSTERGTAEALAGQLRGELVLNSGDTCSFRAKEVSIMGKYNTISSDRMKRCLSLRIDKAEDDYTSMLGVSEGIEPQYASSIGVVGDPGPHAHIIRSFDLNSHEGTRITTPTVGFSTGKIMPHPGDRDVRGVGHLIEEEWGSVCPSFKNNCGQPTPPPSAWHFPSWSTKPIIRSDFFEFTKLAFRAGSTRTPNNNFVDPVYCPMGEEPLGWASSAIDSSGAMEMMATVGMCPKVELYFANLNYTQFINRPPSTIGTVSGHHSILPGTGGFELNELGEEYYYGCNETAGVSYVTTGPTTILKTKSHYRELDPKRSSSNSALCIGFLAQDTTNPLWTLFVSGNLKRGLTYGQALSRALAGGILGQPSGDYSAYNNIQIPDTCDPRVPDTCMSYCAQAPGYWAYLTKAWKGTSVTLADGSTKSGRITLGYTTFSFDLDGRMTGGNVDLAAPNDRVSYVVPMIGESTELICPRYKTLNVWLRQMSNGEQPVVIAPGYGTETYDDRGDGLSEGMWIPNKLNTSFYSTSLNFNMDTPIVKVGKETEFSGLNWLFAAVGKPSATARCSLSDFSVLNEDIAREMFSERGTKVGKDRMTLAAEWLQRIVANSRLIDPTLLIHGKGQHNAEFGSMFARIQSRRTPACNRHGRAKGIFDICHKRMIEVTDISGPCMIERVITDVDIDLNGIKAGTVINALRLPVEVLPSTKCPQECMMIADDEVVSYCSTATFASLTRDQYAEVPYGKRTIVPEWASFVVGTLNDISFIQRVRGKTLAEYSWADIVVLLSVGTACIALLFLMTTTALIYGAMRSTSKIGKKVMGFLLSVFGIGGTLVCLVACGFAAFSRYFFMKFNGSRDFNSDNGEGDKSFLEILASTKTFMMDPKLRYATSLVIVLLVWYTQVIFAYANCIETTAMPGMRRYKCTTGAPITLMSGGSQVQLTAQADKWMTTSGASARSMVFPEAEKITMCCSCQKSAFGPSKCANGSLFTGDTFVRVSTWTTGWWIFDTTHTANLYDMGCAGIPAKHAQMVLETEMVGPDYEVMLKLEYPWSASAPGGVAHLSSISEPMTVMPGVQVELIQEPKTGLRWLANVMDDHTGIRLMDTAPQGKYTLSYSNNAAITQLRRGRETGPLADKLAVLDYVTFPVHTQYACETSSFSHGLPLSDMDLLQVGEDMQCETPLKVMVKGGPPPDCKIGFGNLTTTGVAPGEPPFCELSKDIAERIGLDMDDRPESYPFEIKVLCDDKKAQTSFYIVGPSDLIIEDGDCGWQGFEMRIETSKVGGMSLFISGVSTSNGSMSLDCDGNHPTRLTIPCFTGHKVFELSPQNGLKNMTCIAMAEGSFHSTAVGITQRMSHQASVSGTIEIKKEHFTPKGLIISPGWSTRGFIGSMLSLPAYGMTMALGLTSCRQSMKTASDYSPLCLISQLAGAALECGAIVGLVYLLWVWKTKGGGGVTLFLGSPFTEKSKAA